MDMATDKAANVIFNLEAVCTYPFNICFVHVKTFPWCLHWSSLLPHLLLPLLHTNLVYSFLTICAINIGIPQHLVLWYLLYCFAKTLWALLFMLMISIISYLLGDSQVFVAPPFLLKPRPIYPEIYSTSPFNCTTGTLILGLVHIKKYFPLNLLNLFSLQLIHNLSGYS